MASDEHDSAPKLRGQLELRYDRRGKMCHLVNVAQPLGPSMWNIFVWEGRGRKLELGYRCEADDCSERECKITLSAYRQIDGKRVRVKRDYVNQKVPGGGFWDIGGSELYGDGFTTFIVHFVIKLKPLSDPSNDFTWPSSLTDVLFLTAEGILHVDEQFFGDKSALFKSILAEDKIGIRSKLTMEDCSISELLQHVANPALLASIDSYPDKIIDLWKLSHAFRFSEVFKRCQVYMKRHKYCPSIAEALKEGPVYEQDEPILEAVQDESSLDIEEQLVKAQEDQPTQQRPVPEESEGGASSSSPSCSSNGSVPT